ncbi:hypothetical protein [Tenacibaculum sp. M341]|uniref:hypothetical protein n=1 Tax=Tenacibaculum sp. M341 TaxID=2530339 RepID=UPI001052D456|nr:hypothetical protein [Tenacibaculum sp. M341]TCI94794.1 hypothetical protein EYW44_00295 [Tenacibaculum sp. M341]
MKKFFKILLTGCLGIIVLIFIFFAIILFPVFFPQKPKEKTISDYTDDYVISAYTDHPKFKELTDQFNQQAHRFEFGVCEYKYNDQQFFIGDNPEKITAIFGEPDERRESTRYEFGDSYRYINKDETKRLEELKQTYGDSLFLKEHSLRFEYTSLKIDVSFKRLPNKEYQLRSFSIAMSEEDRFYKSKYKEAKTLFDVIVFRGVPYQLDMTLNEFMELSDLSHYELRRRSRSFFMFQKECPPTKDSRIYTSINSRAVYKVEGGGHLTWTGDFDPHTTYPIKGLSFYKQTLEEYLK